MRTTDSNPQLPATQKGPRPAFTLAERGFIAGVTFGLLALVVDLPSSLAVLGAGLLGAAVGAGISMVKNLDLDLAEAVQALLKRNRLD